MTVTVASALASDGKKVANNGNKDKDKGGKNGEKEKSEKVSTKVTAKTSKVEEFIWSLPREADKVDDNELDKAMIDLYKWYLQNETKVNNNVQQRDIDDGEDVAIPFKVDPRVLQQYMQFIKKNFPGLNTEDLNKRTSAFRKSLEPVSYRDDILFNNNQITK